MYKQENMIFARIGMRIGTIKQEHIQTYIKEYPQHTISFAKWALSKGYITQKQLQTICQNYPHNKISSPANSMAVTQPFPQMQNTSKKLGRYELISILGQGGMGKVYKAYDPLAKREVALKVLLLGEKASKQAITRFQREAKTMAKLNHPGIIKTYDIGEQENQIFFTMDLIQGPSLKELQNSTPLNIEQSVQFIIKVCKIMGYAHDHNVVHRDLKPANIMIDNHNPIVMDFGLAKVANVSKKLSKTGAIMGTLRYMPPEQVEGKHSEICGQADLYSIGAILYELLGRQAIHDATSHLELICQILTKNPNPLCETHPEIPKVLEEICMKALAKQKKHRYINCYKMADDLEKFNQGKKVKVKQVKSLGFKISVIAIGVFLILAGFLYQKPLAKNEIINKKTQKTIEEEIVIIGGVLKQIKHIPLPVRMDKGRLIFSGSLYSAFDDGLVAILACRGYNFNANNKYSSAKEDISTFTVIAKYNAKGDFVHCNMISSHGWSTVELTNNLIAMIHSTNRTAVDFGKEKTVYANHANPLIAIYNSDNNEFYDVKHIDKHAYLNHIAFSKQNIFVTGYVNETTKILGPPYKPYEEDVFVVKYSNDLDPDIVLAKKIYTLPGSQKYSRIEILNNKEFLLLTNFKEKAKQHKQHNVIGIYKLSTKDCSEISSKYIVSSDFVTLDKITKVSNGFFISGGFRGNITFDNDQFSIKGLAKRNNFFIARYNVQQNLEYAIALHNTNDGARQKYPRFKPLADGGFLVLGKIGNSSRKNDKSKTRNSFPATTIFTQIKENKLVTAESLNSKVEFHSRKIKGEGTNSAYRHSPWYSYFLARYKSDGSLMYAEKTRQLNSDRENRVLEIFDLLVQKNIVSVAGIGKKVFLDQFEY